MISPAVQRAARVASRVVSAMDSLIGVSSGGQGRPPRAGTGASPRGMPAGAGVSLWSNGVKVLCRLGLGPALRGVGGMMRQMCYRAKTGELLTRFTFATSAEHTRALANRGPCLMGPRDAGTRPRLPALAFIRARDRSLAGEPAPARGLCLWEVLYGPQDGAWPP